MLYHRDIGFPKTVALMHGTFKLTYSRHALESANNDRYGMMELPETLTVEGKNAIEILVENGKAIKSVYRVGYDDELDMVMVVQSDGFVRTVWFNKKTDKHKTLDHSKYDKP